MRVLCSLSYDEYYNGIIDWWIMNLCSDSQLFGVIVYNVLKLM